MVPLLVGPLLALWLLLAVLIAPLLGRAMRRTERQRPQAVPTDDAPIRTTDSCTEQIALFDLARLGRAA